MDHIRFRRIKGLLTLPLVAFLLWGCGFPMPPKAIEETPEGIFVKHTIEQLLAKDFPPIEAALDPEIRNEGIRGTLEKTAEYFPPGKPVSVKFIGWSFEQFNGQERRTNLTAEYGYSNSQWVLVTVLLRGDSGKFRILGLHVQKMADSLATLNAFTFAGKSWLHYFVIGAMALAFCTTVYALVLCIRTAGLRRKWLWVLFIIFGICAFNLNWTTGEFRVAILHFNLFSAAAIRNGFAGPWILTFCVPVGAMVFLSNRRKLAALRVEDAAANSAPGPASPPEEPTIGQPPREP